MSQYESPSLPAHRPGASRQAPDDPAPSPTTRPWMPALLYSLGFLTVYLLAICTPWGQRAENALFRLGTQGGKEAWIYPLSGAAYGSTPLPPMELSAKPTLMVGLALIVVLTLVRRCWRQGCAALGIVILTTGGKEVLKSTVLPRPDLVGAPENLLDQGFPSGHTAIPAALTLAVVLVVSPRIRPYVATVGVLWLACIAAASATMGGHRPSEVLGATLLACACYGLAVWLLKLQPAAVPGAARSPLAAAVPGATRSARALPVITLALALAVALLSGARNDTLTRSLVSAATAFICAALVWYAAVGRPVHTARRRTGPAPD
ncbi:phosphatase PAP2 family protein [Streptomyces sp. NBC_01012]|uniref:phosphatase PAP2 family protein n=1 Tax=Streptomyces sp. NBC_01012 TaxID=2903717 RepID=UPI0038695451|nr:phosphatase PAP2 family protein [Streptomyces sp. NBC_01012]